MDRIPALISRGERRRATARADGYSRFAVSDVVTRGAIPDPIRRDALAWVGCIAGALDKGDYLARLAAAGFEGIGIEPTRVYKVEDAREFLSGRGLDINALARQVDGKFFSGFVRATKPSPTAKASSGCCAPSCCG